MDAARKVQACIQLFRLKIICTSRILGTYHSRSGFLWGCFHPSCLFVSHNIHTILQYFDIKADKIKLWTLDF